MDSSCISIGYGIYVWLFLDVGSVFYFSWISILDIFGSRLLGLHWISLGSLLDVSWISIGSLLHLYWIYLKSILDIFGVPVGSLLDFAWISLGSIASTDSIGSLVDHRVNLYWIYIGFYWMSIGSPLDLYWISVGFILDYLGSLLDTYWISIGSLLDLWWIYCLLLAIGCLLIENHRGEWEERRREEGICIWGSFSLVFTVVNFKRQHYSWEWRRYHARSSHIHSKSAGQNSDTAPRQRVLCNRAGRKTLGKP